MLGINDFVPLCFYCPGLSRQPHGRSVRRGIRAWSPPEEEAAEESHHVHGRTAGGAGESVWANTLPRHLHPRGTCTEDQTDWGQSPGNTAMVWQDVLTVLQPPNSLQTLTDPPRTIRSWKWDWKWFYWISLSRHRSTSSEGVLVSWGLSLVQSRLFSDDQLEPPQIFYITLHSTVLPNTLTDDAHVEIMTLWGEKSAKVKRLFGEKEEGLKLGLVRLNVEV